jgi:ABC-type lipoprotein export system ATPase subunit
VATSKWVRAHRLRHGFPGTADLFADLSFALNPGDVVAVCGPSGCGKSTLLAILAGWQQPTAGHLEVVGIGRIGWVFQNPYGVSGRTALDHVAFPFLVKGFSRAEAERQALRAMDRFDLVQVRGRRFRELSGGEAQRLMLARAVSVGADLLLVDEPTAQLDLTTAAAVNRTLTNLAQEGTIVVIATHDPGTRAACERVIDVTQADR